MLWRALCGAGFLACAFAPSARQVYGIDLSRRMVSEAYTLAHTRGHHNTAFCQADAEALPFGPHECDLITSKLAFHYFPHPQMALAEMVRLTTPEARVVLIDRVGRRRGDASDADAAVVDLQAMQDAGPKSWRPIDAAADLDAVVRQAASALPPR